MAECDKQMHKMCIKIYVILSFVMVSSHVVNPEKIMFNLQFSKTDSSCKNI